MYKYEWDKETGGVILLPEPEKMSLEPRPVYYRELDILGFNKHWNYEKDDFAPLMWATANNYIYRGRLVAKTKGGALYTPPELELIEEPEPSGNPLRPVDISAMTAKNAELMETLEQDTIQRIYNTYRKYKSKVDVFYVAFSGGKDSIVTLDLVQRALPHDEFMVLFGDTGMEFPDTYDVVAKTEKWCDERNIKFYTARSHFDPLESWKIFGPPATICRWCCSVHKTSPQILLLRKISQNHNFRGMAMVGVRADESLARSKYSIVSYEMKHRGQYNFNVILNWSSTEIYLSIFKNKLLLNDAYKKGNRRVGCLMCPRASEHGEYFAQINYPSNIKIFINSIQESYSEAFTDTKRLDNFIQNGAWKARKSSRDIIGIHRYKDDIVGDKIVLSVYKPLNDWKEWLKTLGEFTEKNNLCTINFKTNTYKFKIIENPNGYDVIIDKGIQKQNPTFIKHLKNVFRKSAYCVGCLECEANCHFGCLTHVDGKIKISDDCVHCLECHNIELGCLIAASRKIPKEGNTTLRGSLNRYSHHAPKMEWVNQFFSFRNDFWEKHTLGSKMLQYFKRFLKDVQLIENEKFSTFAETISKIGIQEEKSWALMLVHLTYTSQINWLIKKVDFIGSVTKTEIVESVVETGMPEAPAKDVWASIVRFTELPFSKVGLGNVEVIDKKNSYLRRTPWQNPDPKVILYSLYKFAEACGDMRQFSLETLLDDTIEREGVSPTRIFGLDYDVMRPLLNGLSANYPDFISASFTLGMDSITLRPDKKSEDVLYLF
ncbi:MAG: phosphoadenosine phosphosulfate reductase family protein [Selenomonadaceae bacterium]|nr:phosphoadenosine phosphosulfate reductase family protein [Selenomonadaceae bacterium]